MLFNSQIFVFLFLPVVWCVYFGLHKVGAHKAAKAALLIASIVFYGYYNMAYVPLLVGSIIFNYGIFMLLGQLSQKPLPGVRKAVMALGVAANLMVLFYYKYFNFFVDNINRVLKTDFGLENIILPLGISFFTFQQVSFLVDRYRGETDEYSLLDYSVFVAFFPQLVAGPIVLHKELIPQFSQKERFKPNWENIMVGLRYFVLGLFKKTMIADRFGNLVNLGYVYPFERDLPGTVLIILSYTLQIYFDFSGYSDMAIGLGKLFGVDIPVNFNEPYKAATIAEFWNRWHMTMTGFFTKYLYIPLGGSRKGKIRTYINTMIVFTLSGLWHGAAWAFVAWGMVHGLALVFHRIFKKYIEKLPRLLTGLFTFGFVNMAWVLFRTESIGKTVAVAKRLFVGGFSGNNMDLCHAFVGDNLEIMLQNISYSAAGFDMLAVVVTVIGLLTALLVVFLAPSSHHIANRKTAFAGEGIVFAVMAVLAIMTFTNVSTFLYFNF